MLCVQKRPSHQLTSSYSGDCILRAESTGWDIRFNEIRETGRSESIYNFVSHQRHLTVWSDVNRKPEKWGADWCNVIEFSGSSEDSSCSIRNHLKAFSTSTQQSRQQNITRIKSGWNMMKLPKTNVGKHSLFWSDDILSSFTFFIDVLFTVVHFWWSYAIKVL